MDLLIHGRGEQGFAYDGFVLAVAGSGASVRRYFPLSHAGSRGSTIGGSSSAIVFVIKNGLRWRDAPRAYGPHKTIYNRFVRRSRLGVFNKIFAELARKGGKPERILIDATHLKAHRTAASRLKRACSPTADAPKAA